MVKTVMGERDKAARAVLAAEAERRVRGGETREAVGAALGVSRTTMTRWAARGRWRGKDLDREAAGLPVLPLPYYARADCGVSAGSAPRGGRAVAAAVEANARAGALDLAGEAAALAQQALVAVREGREKAADGYLRAADRLLRIKRRLGEVDAAGPSAAQQARARLEAMDLDALRGEIRRLAGPAAGGV